MSFDKGFNQLGVARNKPRSHTVDAKCNLTRSSGVSRYSGVLDGGRTGYTKLNQLHICWALCISSVNLLVSALFPPTNDRSDEVNTNDSSNNSAN
jgi:hypothetical protein